MIWKHRISVGLLKNVLLQWAVTKCTRQRSSERVGWGDGSPCTVCSSWGMCPIPGTLAKPHLCPGDRNPPGPVPLLTSPRPPILNVSVEQGPAAFTPARPPPVSGSQPEAKVNETCQRPKAKVNCPCCNSSTLPGAKQTSLLKSCTRLTLSYENQLTVFLPHPWVLRRERSSSASLWFYWTSLVQRGQTCASQVHVSKRGHSPGNTDSSSQAALVLASLAAGTGGFSSPESNRQSPRGWPDVQTSCSNSKLSAMRQSHIQLSKILTGNHKAVLLYMNFWSILLQKMKVS